jgi:hypothetical protein
MRASAERRRRRASPFSRRVRRAGRGAFARRPGRGDERAQPAAVRRRGARRGRAPPSSGVRRSGGVPLGLSSDSRRACSPATRRGGGFRLQVEARNAALYTWRLTRVETGPQKAGMKADETGAR